MSPTGDIELAIIGNPPNLVELLRKEINLDGVKVKSHDTDKTNYKIVVIDPTDPNASQRAIEADITTNTKTQKVLVILVIDSFLERKLLDPLLLKINLKQNENTSNMRTIIALDLYSPDHPRFISHFETWLSQISDNGKIKVSPKGNFPLYPLSFEDLAKASVKSLFSRNTKGELFCLGGDEIMDLELAYLLKNSLSDQGIDIDLDTTKSDLTPFCNKNDLIEAQAKLNWLPKSNFSVDFKKLTKKILEGDHDKHKKNPYEALFKTQKKIDEIKTPAIEEKLSIKNTTKRGVGSMAKIFLAAVLLLLTIPIVSFSLFLFLNVSFLYQSYQEFRQTNPDKARNTLKTANAVHRSTGFWFQVLVPVTAPIFPNTVKEINNFYLLLDHASDFLTSVYDSYSLSNRYYQELIGRTESNNPQLLSAINLSLNSLLDNLSQIQLLTYQSKLPFGIKTKFQDASFSGQIQTLKKQLNTGVSLIELLQKISLKKTPTKILVLVQDENELRGSGGYLNTTIQITIIDNKIVDHQVEPALNVDKLIDGRVEPPKIINTALGQNNWFFRDSNLSGVFPEAAEQASWFFNRFKNSPVQGVVAINSSLFKTLLKDLGPISLSGGQIVATDNLSLLLASLTVDPQNDILTLLSENLMSRLKMGEIPFIPLARALSKEIEDRNLSLWFESEDLESSVPLDISQKTENNVCHPQLFVFGCKQDLIYLNENNLSVNKINLYLKRDQIHQVEINNEGGVSYNLTYQYTYPVPVPNNLNQTYNAYYQLYLSPHLKLSSAYLDEKELSLSQITERLTNIRKYDFYLPQTINQTHNLNLKVSSGLSTVTKSGQFPYSVYFQKQPGTNDSLKFELKYPVFFSPKLLTTPMQNSASNLLLGSFKSLPKDSLGVLFQSSW